MGVSLADVARAAGTSIATASRVLSGSPHPVADATRRRVQQKARELGFTPNALARALAKRTAQMVGVLVGDITDPYFAEVARGVSDVVDARDYLTVVCNSDRDPGRELSYLRMLTDHRATGVLLVGGAFRDAPEMAMLVSGVKAAMRAGTRVVCLAERALPGVPVISVDERAALYDLTSFLIRLGHRKIAFVEGPGGLSTSALRLQGFEQAMRDNGLVPSLRFPGGFGVESGRAAAAAMLASTLPDAVVAATDETAVGVLLTLRQAGVNVPHQVSIAGVDDSRYSQIMNLTTVRLPSYVLGALGARRLLGLDGTPQAGATVLSHRVIPRGTTTRRPRSGADREALRMVDAR